MWKRFTEDKPFVSKHCQITKRLKLGEVLNIDEFKGDSWGEKYQTIIADSQNKKILDVLPTRKFDYFDKYFSQIPKEEKDKVKIFVSDMYRPYRDIKKKHFPNAKHLIDRYHFIRQVTWGFKIQEYQNQKRWKNKKEYTLCEVNPFWQNQW